MAPQRVEPKSEQEAVAERIAAPEPVAQPSQPEIPAPRRGPEEHPEIVRHASAAFNARVSNVVRKQRRSDQ